MAYVDMSALEYAPSKWPIVGAEVYAKAAWEDEWEWLPFVYPASVEEGVAPTVGTSEFGYRFGRIMRSGATQFAYWLPYRLAGAYVAVRVFTRWDEALLWVGQIDAETVAPHGHTRWTSGVQGFKAFELTHLLDRRAMFGSYTKDGYIDRPLTFNRRKSNAVGVVGNRTLILPEGTGAHYFAADGSTWSNLDIVRYILAFHVNVGGGAPNFYVVGDYWALDDIVEEHDLDGMTPWAALNKLIDRRRGLGFRVLTSGSGDCYLYVFSTLPYPVMAGGLQIPANSFQNNVSFSGARMISEPQITFDNLAYFDHIVVRGAAVTSTFSVSVADGTLAPGWSIPDEEQYKLGNQTLGEEASEKQHDAERQTEKFSHVYRRWRIPAEEFAWTVGDGLGTGEPQNAAPGITWFGEVDPSFQLAQWNYAKRIERWLPIAEEGSSFFEPQMRKPFVLVPILLDEDTEEEALQWAYIDQLEALNMDGFNSVGVGLDDDEMAIVLRPRIGHELALGYFNEDDEGTMPTQYKAFLDASTMLATVTIATDTHLKIELFANGFGPGEIGRTKFIDMPDCRLDYVVPGTVIDVTDGALIRHEGGVVKNDFDRIYQAAALALAWYSTPRAKVSYTFEYMSLMNPAGYMIRNLLGSEGLTNVNSVVTRRTWKWKPNGAVSTTVETNYEELSFELGGRNRRGRSK